MIFNSRTVTPALQIGQLVDLVYSVLHELLVLFVGLDPIEHCDAVGPTKDVSDVQHLG